MMDSQGNRLTGVVLDIGEEQIKMDFNHPLAGNDLHFKGQVLQIREATEDELRHGHAHEHHNCDDCNDPDCHTGTGI
jgi:FKBP-type peptidyl-prolyl cis-trans isomerase SlyD